LWIHCQSPHLAASWGYRYASLLIGQRRSIEELGDALPTLDFDEQTAAPVVGERECQSGRDGGFTRATFARHDVERDTGPQCIFGFRGAGHYPSVITREPHYCAVMTTWEYVTVPLLVHATKQILDTWGQDGWELVQVTPGPNSENMVAYFKRPLPS
jgi:hypothetical protein